MRGKSDHWELTYTLGVAGGRGGWRDAARRVLGPDILVHELAEGGGKLVVVAVQSYVFLAVDVHGAAWFFAGAGEADADVGGF